MLRLARGDLANAVQYIEAADQGISETGWLDAHPLILVGKGEIMCEVGRLDEPPGAWRGASKSWGTCGFL
jgi:hypothetical protein